MQAKYEKLSELRHGNANGNANASGRGDDAHAEGFPAASAQLSSSVVPVSTLGFLSLSSPSHSRLSALPQADFTEFDSSEAALSRYSESVSTPIHVSSMPSANESVHSSDSDFAPLNLSSDSADASLSSSSPARCCIGRTPRLSALTAFCISRHDRFSKSSFYAVTLLIISAFIFSIMSLFVSLAGKEDVPSYEIAWLRFIIQLMLTSFTLRYRGIPLLGPAGSPFFWLIARGVVGVLSLTSFYFCIVHLNLADATVLFFCAPIFTGFMAWLFVREKYHVVDAIAACVSIGGVLLVVRPVWVFGEENSQTTARSTGFMHTLAIAFGLIGALLNASVFVLIRKIGKAAPSMVLVQYLALAGFLLCPLGIVLEPWVVPSAAGCAYVLIAGLCGFFGQVLFNYGTLLESATLSAMIRQLDIVFSFVWQIVFLQESVYLLSVAGAIAIVASSSLTAARKYWQEKKARQRSTSAAAQADADNEQLKDSGASDLMREDPTNKPWQTRVERSVSADVREMEVELARMDTNESLEFQVDADQLDMEAVPLDDEPVTAQLR